MTYETNYLAHYGVKGMKWGVRRDLKKRSIAGAKLGYKIKKQGRRIQKINDKIYKKMSKGADGDALAKLKAKKNNAEKKRTALANVQKKLYKGLSQSDIDQGKRHVAVSRAVKKVLATTAIAAGVTVAAAGGAVALLARNKFVRTAGKAWTKEAVKQIISGGLITRTHTVTSTSYGSNGLITRTLQ